MILFIDTHDELITVALKNNDTLYIKTKESEYSHSIYTMPLIESLFKENNLDVKDLNKIIVVNGPGSFTGIRIGLSIAKTMAFALNIDINTISSLKAYLISNPGGKRKSVIEDNKGYYICAMDENNKVIVDEYYSTIDNEDYPVVENKLDVDLIIEYLKNNKSEDPHHVSANYVKKIEVEHDK
jgi:tRNA threonylcarbamoyl adenosine modification protein YeaZ